MESSTIRAPQHHREVKAYDANLSYEGNAICTSRYTPYDFIPKNLWEQMHHLANVYFVIMLFLQTRKSISPTGGIPTMALPLTIVMGATAVKDYWEDYKCKNADKVENNHKATVLLPSGGREHKRWRDLRPGDVIELTARSPVPADTLLLSSSDPKRVAYVETKDLDGEADLKRKVCPVLEGWNPKSTFGGLSATFQLPTNELYKFHGTLQGHGIQEVNVNQDNLLLRGSTLQQTDWVLGLVLYCGHETRVMLNAKLSRFKQSELGAVMNRLIFYIFALQFIICIISGMLSVLIDNYETDPWYLITSSQHQPQSSTSFAKVSSLFVEIGKWVLLLNNMVPISLIVTLNTVTLLQGRFLEQDPQLTDPKNTAMPHAEVHCSQVIESLGQATHLLSDKTGTLTRNVMNYKACSVLGHVYGDGGSKKPHQSSQWQHDLGSFLKDLSRTTSSAEEKDRQRSMIYMLLCHALCHTVTVKSRGTCCDSKEYLASSVDELALVRAMEEFGLQLVGSESAGIELAVLDRALNPALQAAGISPSPDGQVFIPIEAVCDFDSDRKRMSVVARLGDRRVLFVKGADSTMLPLSKADEDVAIIKRDVKTFATSGLRTLVFGCREIDGNVSGVAGFDLDTWQKDHMEAQRIPDSRKVQDLVEELENGLELLGATGIEDELQEGVNETIAHVRAAGIVVWVMTGDKVETAINIAHACSLFTERMQHVEIEEGGGATRTKLTLTVDGVLQDEEDFWKLWGELPSWRPTDKDERETGFTITGGALGIIMNSGEDRKRQFYERVSSCKSVLCCRVSPNQKAQVVQMVKHYHKRFADVEPVTVAVGDGANDVAMINEAHVGVGIAGKEGAQAARTADYAISKFKMLERLLFVHGREAYRRNSVLICYCFYKNMILVLPMFFFGFQTEFSGAGLYEQILFQFYNVTFTAIPIMVFALFDRAHENLDRLVEDPKMYVPGRERKFFNGWVLLWWMVAAVLQAFALSCVASMVLWDGSIGSGGFVSGDLWTSGSLVYLWVIIGANMTLIGRMNTFLNISVVALAGSILCHPMMLWLTEAAGIGVPVSLQGAFTYIYGAGAPRSFIVSCLALAFFSLLGEPFLRSADEHGATDDEIEERSSDGSSCCPYTPLSSSC